MSATVMINDEWLWSLNRLIPNDPVVGRQVLEQIREQLEAQQWDEREIFGVRLAVDEALVNAMKHGNRQDAGKQVGVVCKLSAKRLWIRIADEGPGFTPEAVPDCTEPENLERPCGRGIMLMRSFMSRVEYNPQGNAVEMEKQR